jgi:hypothetical protein
LHKESPPKLTVRSGSCRKTAAYPIKQKEEEIKRPGEAKKNPEYYRDV